MNTGRDEARKKIAEILPKIGLKVEKALTVGSVVIGRESLKEVPVDEGVLRSTFYTIKKGSGMATNIELGYSDPKAIYVHENLNAAHGETFNAFYKKQIAAGKTHRRKPGEKAKFLEDPIKQHIDQIQENVAKAFK